MMKTTFLLMATIWLSGCSLVQWLPSSSCEKVKYERVGNKVKVNAECEI
jgi:hypothetical protein